MVADPKGGGQEDTQATEQVCLSVISRLQALSWLLWHQMRIMTIIVLLGTSPLKFNNLFYY